MQAVKQLLLLVMASVRKAYTHSLGVYLFFLAPLLLQVYGFFELALATALFLWCVIARPSVELKNMRSMLWSLRSAPVIALNWLILEMCHPELVSGSIQTILMALVLPLLVFLNLYVLDSGLHVRRLLYAPLGLAKMYWYTSYLCIPAGLPFALGVVFLPWVLIILVLVPVFTVFCSLVYYKQLYAQFRIYYAAD